MDNEQRINGIMKDLKDNTLGLDDTFTFKCRVCGKCCKNRQDILLTPRDLFNIAKDLGRTIIEILDRYCESYIGESSRIPIIRLKPLGYENACPFLMGKRCIVHKSKPAVCALFPLGRATVRSKEGVSIDPTANIQSTYFVQPVKCGSSEPQTYTVRSWLEDFGLPVDDEFYILWTQTTIFLSEYFRNLEAHKTPANMLNQLWNVTFTVLYTNYDSGSDFVAQFREHASTLKKMLTLLGSKAHGLTGGAPDGE